ncbi:hypothetical protein [Microcoleus sp. FACHB-68]|uniref:baeRF3 domain-containing protein n=1 Tax=Microcoleus sp. FACHB-68 TaxID=2692826 RepID=UPI0016863E82|nr:hypothetical protein [Microcoleus sp. FACHB-68]MBD1938481.1 hypothetical protein [Microcoleus sp. FACHB-68]
MTLLSVEELKNLVEQPTGVSVSIYMPIYRVGQEIQQNPVRFKNLVREAEDKLEEFGFEKTEIRKMLEPALQEIDEATFWENQNNGLAIFIAPDFFHYYRSPLSFDELVVVADNFHLKPLMPLLTGDGLFYVLALSQQQVRLLECTRSSATEVEVENLPKSMDDALQYDPTAKDGQFRISTSKGGTNNSFQHAGSFHGQGSPDQDKSQQDIEQYFHMIDHALHEFLRNRKAPLVLAGVEYLFPIYREANTYPHLVAEGITGNPEHLKPEELQEQALPIVEPIFLQAQQEAMERYQELAAITEKTSTDLKEAVPAAYYGRVEELFVAVGVQQWGTFNRDTNTIEIHQEAEVGDDDLLNSAAIQTILNGGTVYAVEPEKVPAEAPLAAVFRY